jgi:hypothetical protein
VQEKLGAFALPENAVAKRKTHIPGACVLKLCQPDPQVDELRGLVFRVILLTVVM